MLRGNGFTVLLADNIEGALDRAKQNNPDIILASIAVCHPGELTDRLKTDAELAKVPSIVLVKGAQADELPPGFAAREALDQLMAKIVAAPPRSVPVEVSQGEVRGDLSQVPLIDL